MAIFPTNPKPGKPSTRIGLFSSTFMCSLMYVSFTLSATLSSWLPVYTLNICRRVRIWGGAGFEHFRHNRGIDRFSAYIFRISGIFSGASPLFLPSETALRFFSYSRVATLSPSIFALPPVGSASVAPQTLHVTLFVALLKSCCSFPHFKHLTRKKLLLGLGINLFHSLIFYFASLNYRQFAEAYTVFVTHVVADFALKSQGLFLSGLGKFMLKRILLSAIPCFFSSMVTLAFC
jgi:hypothetical protein